MYTDEQLLYPWHYLDSLRGGVERFAFSCVWEVNPDTAEFLSTKFCKSIIKSKKAMTYEEAQNRIDDDKDQSDLTLSLRRLMKLSKILKGNRRKLGALQLAGSEVRFTVDRETADPIDVQRKKVAISFIDVNILQAKHKIAPYTAVVPILIC
jgi:exosome complex exonuclease DIS3/RRP44